MDHYNHLKKIGMINYEVILNNDITMTSSQTLNRPMAVRGGVCDGPISRFVHNVIVYMCTKFGAFITKCTIALKF